MAKTRPVEVPGAGQAAREPRLGLGLRVHVWPCSAAQTEQLIALSLTRHAHP